MAIRTPLNTLSLYDRLVNKVLTYYATVWQDRRAGETYKKWLANFGQEKNGSEKEQLHAIYLLSKFMYFGNLELRELLKSVFRDLYKYPIVSEIRINNGNSKNIESINKEFDKALSLTRFLGVGNPSESGVHLLYYFRQENALPKDLFINIHEIFKNNEVSVDSKKSLTLLGTRIRDEKIRRYIFIDDFCGSGTQATEYLAPVVNAIKSLDPKIEVYYFMLFATEIGSVTVKSLKTPAGKPLFDRVSEVFLIDESFKCFSKSSRFFDPAEKEIDKDFCRTMCASYGAILMPSAPLGFKDGQLLLSFFHNTPDNTLPVFWTETPSWTAIFKRFHKIS